MTNIVKLVTNSKNEVIYISRANIPHAFKNESKYFKKHLSVVSFKPESLITFGESKISELEKIEDIELLRALENNLKVGTFTIKSDTFSVDILEDYLKAKKYFKSDKIKKNYL